MKRFRYSRIILAGLSVMLMLQSCVVGNYMTDYALRPKFHGQNIEGSLAYVDRSYPGTRAWYDSLKAVGIFKDTTIVGERGFKLHGAYAAVPQGTAAEGTAICIHGYTGNFVGMLHIARMYYEEFGWNVLLPDLHYHGLSEGEAIQMGWNDRLDMKHWIKAAHDVFGSDKMVLHGISMGAATTMMVSGEPDIPEYVKGYIEDCGYSTVWDQFAEVLKTSFHLPPFPVLYSANHVTNKRYGWEFKEASALEAVARCERPMLFIHGDDDDYVPTRFVYPLYDAKTKGYKQIWIAPDTRKHAMSFQNHTQEYIETVRGFLQKL